MLRIFFRDSFVYTLGNVLTRGIGFLMLPIYARFFSPEKFGVIDLLTVTGTILAIVVGLEVHQAVARFFPEETEVTRKRSIVSTAFWFILLFYIIFFILGYFSAPLISQSLFGKTDYTELVRIAFLSFGFNFLYYFASSQLRWQLKSKENLLVSVLYSILSAIIALGLLVYFSFGVEAIFYAQICAAIISLFFSVYFSREYYGLVFDSRRLRQLTSFSLPLVFSSLMVYAMLYVDRFIITYLLDASQLGLYSFAYRIASVVGLLIAGAQAALTPLIYNKYREEGTPEGVAKLFRYFGGGACILILTLFIISESLVSFIGGSEFRSSGALVPWIAISILFTGVTSFTPGVFIEKKTRIVVIINTISFLINLTLCYGLVQFLGLEGAVYATAICSFIYFLMYYVIGQKYYYIPVFRKSPKKAL
ncbi:oligosaccharide flippase family protein [Bdellovibrio bacteriovorus]|uniref:oligosaccharide flippase family protein n=1 Tax=Bdellovibrio bacteriovorus TaxID=959 RepID=UPI0035A97C02